MENKLEQLLNNLIEKGWKPYNYSDVYIETGEWYSFRDGFIILRDKKWWTYEVVRDYSWYRDLVSKESWLWQFVCENGMILKENHERVYDVSWWEYWVDCKAQIISREPEYRLIESSLCDEDKLEDFLLNSIKLD